MIVHCCRQKLPANKYVIEFPTSPTACRCTTLKNATAYTSLQKLLNTSAIHAVISLLFWWYLLLTSSLLLHDVIMTSHCCQRYAECLVTTLCSNETVHRHTGTVPRTCNSWTTVSRNAKLSWTQLVASKQPRSSPVDYKIWTVTQHRGHYGQIHSVDELKWRFIDVWCGVRSWTFEFWRGYWPVARKTPSVCPR